MPTFAIDRHRLLTLLDVATHQRVTIVVAPTGYGKSILLAQWAAAQVRRRPRWITMTADHDDPARFAGALCHALASPFGASPEALVRRVDGTGDRLGAPFLEALLDDLDGMPPSTLVLDDFHRLGNPALLDELGTIIDYGPKSLHVVIATRVDPPLAYYRWRLSDTLVEVRQEDLAFTSDEATTLVGRLTGHDLDPAQIDALVERTEGWAVGVHLAAVALRKRPDADEFLETITSAERNVGDYLTEEVVRRQPESDRRFLLATSAMRQMNGPMCEFVTGHPRAQALLEEFERASLFITRVGARRGFVRYHELFHALLRHHLRDEDPELELRLLRRAAEWHRRRGELDAAVDYLAEARDWDTVLDMAREHGGTAPGRADASLVARWIEQVPEAIRQARPDVMLLDAAALAIAGEIVRADDVLDRLGRMQPPIPEDEVVAEALRSYCALQRGHLSQSVSAADRVLSSVGSLDEDRIPNVLGLTGSRADVVAAASLTRGVSLLYEGALREARHCLAPVAAAAPPLWQITALGALSVLEAWSGSLNVAEAMGMKAISLAEQLGLEQHPATADAYLGLARVARDHDETERAATLLEELSLRLRPGRRPALTACSLMEQALLSQASGAPDRGPTTVAIRRPSDHHALPVALLARMHAVEAQLLISAGDLEGAARVLRSAPGPAVHEVASARVRLAIEQQDLRAARTLVAEWPDRPKPRATLEPRLWLAVIDHLSGDEGSARAHLAAVTAQAEPEWDLGVFRAAGYHVLGPARALYRSRPTPFVRAIVENPHAARLATRSDELVEQLTDREEMVLALLPQHLSNAAIADRLGVSLNTVKTHLAHIYRKFGVGSRAAAVEAAECMRIL